MADLNRDNTEYLECLLRDRLDGCNEEMAKPETHPLDRLDRGLEVEHIEEILEKISN